MNIEHPILYSFRRCPYAMRARLAIIISGITVELREVILKNKPQQLLDISAKGTVPVLMLENGTVIDESLDIMFWALSYNDPDNWLEQSSMNDIKQLIEINDGEFKYFLDRYKYADRFPENSEIYYRQKAEVFLIELETRLSKQSFLCARYYTLADMAIFPFIRQFANVDINWFQGSDYKNLKRWLNELVESSLFLSIMDKYSAWQATDKKLLFNCGPKNH